MTAEKGDVIDIWQAAWDDHSAVLSLIRDLVRIPSRGGIDSYEPVLDRMASWLTEHQLACRRLQGHDDMTVALAADVHGARPGPCYVLDACLDTAPFGDQSSWTFPPASGEIADGWMHGRGTADSKSGAAIFAQIAARLSAQAKRLRGQVVLLFDVDEHTGSFGGAKAYFGKGGGPESVDGVMIGYPGLDHLVTGGRGILRAHLVVYGVASHSGGRKVTPSAIAKAAGLVSALHAASLPGPAGPDFPLPARLTVTAISGGEGYSAVPGSCALNVDIRLTPAFGQRAAISVLQAATAAVDRSWPGTRQTALQVTSHWPAFALPQDSALRGALLAAASDTGLNLTAKVAGPSNIGNYLVGMGIPATAGFGVDYVGLHGTDERIRIDSIPLVQAVYHKALLKLLSGD